MAVPTSTDSNFERTFADIAYARMRDKAPSLLDHLVGFQIIDKDDEETHAVGVFAFKVGKEWVYAPVFFINGELKGYELMYIKSQDAFVPLVEQWVNYVLNRRPAVLGEQEDKPRNELPLRQPDFDVFARSPYIGSKWAGQFRPSYNQIVEKISPDYHAFVQVFRPEQWPNTNKKFASLNTRFTIPGALKVLGKQAMINLVETMKHDQKFANSILSHYDFRDIAKTAEEEAKTTVEVTNYDSAIPEPGKKPKDKQKRLTPEEQDAKGREEQLLNELAPAIPLHKGAMVITRGDRELVASLNDEERSALLCRKFLVKDARVEDEQSKLYTTQVSQSVQSPDQNGIYEVLGSSGGKRKMLVAPKILRSDNIESREGLTLVVDLDNKAFGNFYNTDILAGQQYGNKEWESFLGSCVDPQSVKPGSKLLLVSPRGEVTAPFEIRSKTENNEGQVEVDVSFCYCPAPRSSSAAGLGCMRTSAGDSYSEPIDALVFTGKETPAGFKQIGRSLFVPKGIRAFVLEEPPKKDDPCPSLHGSSRGTLDIGNINEFWQQLHKESQAKGSRVREFRLLTDGIVFRTEVNGLQSQPFSKVACIKHLVEEAGLNGADSEFLVKEARPRQSVKYFLKLAQGYSGYGNGDVPMQGYFPEPPMGTEKGIMAPVMYPQTALQNLGNIDPYNRQLYRDFRYLDDNARDQANMASQQGQKEVLDTSVISGLVKTMDTDNAVDGYIGDLLLGLDRIGRILFMFYWHYDKFKERYGQQDLPELEDNLRNVFTNLGELTLFLKQKTIEPDKADSSEVQLTDVLT